MGSEGERVLVSLLELGCVFIAIKQQQQQLVKSLHKLRNDNSNQIPHLMARRQCCFLLVGRVCFIIGG